MQLGSFLAFYLFSHLICKVDKFIGVRTSYLTWLEVTLVHTLLAVLKVKTHIIEFETFVIGLVYHAAIL